MNGSAGFWDKGTVVDSLIYIVSFIGEDGSVIQQGDLASLRIGIQNPDEKGRKAVQTVSEISVWRISIIKYHPIFRQR